MLVAASCPVNRSFLSHGHYAGFLTNIKNQKHGKIWPFVIPYPISNFLGP